MLDGIPPELREPLLDEFGKIVRNYREQRWEPAELNGGKFSEIVYTILRGHVDGKFASSPYKPGNMVEACRALEHATTFPRSVRIQIPRLLLGLYEIRNNRNVGHVGADVDPNRMDATVVLQIAKWVMAELVRIFHGTTTDAATAAVESLTERTVPLVWKSGPYTRVLSSNLTAVEKVLVLLYSEGVPVSARTLATSVEYTNLSRFRTKVLKDAHKDTLVHFDSAQDCMTITPVGIRHVEEQIPLEI